MTQPVVDHLVGLHGVLGLFAPGRWRHGVHLEEGAHCAQEPLVTEEHGSHLTLGARNRGHGGGGRPEGGRDSKGSHWIDTRVYKGGDEPEARRPSYSPEKSIVVHLAQGSVLAQTITSE